MRLELLGHDPQRGPLQRLVTLTEQAGGTYASPAELTPWGMLVVTVTPLAAPLPAAPEPEANPADQEEAPAAEPGATPPPEPAQPSAEAPLPAVKNPPVKLNLPTPEPAQPAVQAAPAGAPAETAPSAQAATETPSA